MKHGLLLASALIATGFLGSCSSARETLGLNRSAPDEFAVVKRAPLALPPNYELRPPRPGAPRPQEQSPDRQAKETVFGSRAASSASNADTEAESLLLERAGAQNTDPSIREVVDQETGQVRDENKPVVDRLLGFTGMGGDNSPQADVIDAQEEAERLRREQPQQENAPDDTAGGE